MTTRPDPTLPDDELALLATTLEGPNPYTDGDPDRQDDPPVGLFAARVTATGGTTAEAMAFLRGQHEDPDKSWKARCLELQRTARRRPAVYPSAVSAAAATPEAERIYDMSALRRGMVAYSDDPNDGNPYGHIWAVAGWVDGKVTGDLDDVLAWTNDMVKTGSVDLVRASSFQDRWGDSFQFGATWLNGYSFPEFDRPTPPPPPPVHLGATFSHAISDVRTAMKRHRKMRAAALARGDQAGAARQAQVIAALARDLAELRQTVRSLR